MGGGGSSLESGGAFVGWVFNVYFCGGGGGLVQRVNLREIADTF